MAITLSSAYFVPRFQHSSPRIPITVYLRKNTLFGATLMSGGKGAVTEGTIEEESTAEYIVDPEAVVQVWG